jgi:hypothetical protein
MIQEQTWYAKLDSMESMHGSVQMHVGSKPFVFRPSELGLGFAQLQLHGLPSHLHVVIFSSHFSIILVI